MKKALKIIALICIASFLSIQANAIENNGWYCVRNKNHNQPTLAKEWHMVEKYDVFWVDKEHTDMNSDDKIIYLTFDAGYENGNVEKIVDILNEEDVKGVFFVLDNILLKNKDLIRKMIDGGHTVANHTMKHKDMTKIKSKEDFSRELNALEELYEREYGEKMVKLYRPPEGKLNEQNLKWLKELGYKTVMWSFAYADWDNDRQMSSEKAKEKIFENLHNGEVMLLHPTSSTNAEIIRDLIKTLKGQGFRFGTIEEPCK
ncbi:MAG: polysaccharide deacetylase family protein [Clostridia bacterium]|nr:polysaccharide deacetylase family protein [Clostridia bacterium]